MIKRKIAVVITARPSYSRIKSVLTEIKKHPKLELQLIVAASALLNKYGNAIDYILNDGFKVIAKVYNILEGENLTSAAKTTGLGIVELSSVFKNIKPDIVITIADRYETMSTAIASSYMNIPLAHIQGGEVTGNIDEKVRHSITKLADYHFVASNDAAERVIKLGENSEMVFNTGCPSIDLAHSVSKIKKLDFNPYQKYGGVGSKPNLSNGYLVVMQHSVTNEYNDSQKNIEITLNAIKILNMPTLWFWPNIDAGSDGTSSGIRSFREKYELKNIHFFKNMEPIDFLNLLDNSIALIGNSSVGIRECSYLGIPVVNIGTRQNRRLRGSNVIDVDYKVEKILESVRNILNLKSREKSTIYGNGNSGKKIANLLSEIPLIFHKTINY